MDTQEQGEISIKELILKAKEWSQYIISKWLIILIVGIIGSLLGLGYAFTKDPIYIAEVTFALEEKGASGSGISSIASSFGFSIGGSEGGAFAGDNIMVLMKSRNLIEKSLLKTVYVNNKPELLINKYIKFNKLREVWDKDPKLKDVKFENADRANFTTVQNSILGQICLSIMVNNLIVDKFDKKSSIISVKMITGNEEFSKLFCETLVENVTNFYIQTKVGKAKVNILNLEDRVDSVKRELDNAMYGRAAFADRNQGLIRQSAAVPKLKQEMRVQMLGTMYGELVKNLEFSKLALMREEPLIQIIDSPYYPLKKDLIGKFKAMKIGAFLSMFLFICYLLVIRTYKIVMED